MTIIRHKASPTGFALVVTTYDNGYGFTATYQRYSIMNDRTIFEESQAFSSESAAIAIFDGVTL